MNAHTSTDCATLDSALTDQVSEAMSNFEKELANRHQNAYAREGISYAVSSGILSPYMKLQLEYRPNLGGPGMNREFHEL